MSDRVRSHWLGPPLLAALLATGPVQAQIVTDGTVGPKVSLRGGEIEIGANLGTRRGDNLFHSFEKFGIASGQTATFTGPGAIRNVISRVTGGEVSTIDGKLASKVGQADLYFLNPAGVMFGSNATLDVPGSLHVSTAHELRFADGARFSALDRTGSGLTVTPPEAFGFLDPPPGRIAVDQSQLYLQPGKTLSLVGGDIDIVGGSYGFMAVERGTINLAAVASAGQVRVLDSAVDAARQGAIRVADQALINVSGNGGGTIRIRGGTLEVQNSLVFADNNGDRDSTMGLDLQAGTIEITNSRVTADVLGSGRGGAANVNAGHLVIRNGGQISGSTFASGDAGTVAVKAGRLLVSGANSDAMITSSANSGSTGRAGSVAVTAHELELRNGGMISTSTFARGHAGTVNVQADRLLISGDGSALATGISSTAEPASTGSAGDVQVIAEDDLQVRNGGTIDSSTFSSGHAGTVNVKAGHLLVSADGSKDFTAISSTAQPHAGALSRGAAGTVTVTARELKLHDGGQISSATLTQGNAGQITVKADRVIIEGTDLAGHPSAIGTSATFSSTDKPHSGPLSTGAAGTVTVMASDLELHDGGQISSDTLTQGNAGQITVKANRVIIEGTDLAGHPSAIASFAVGSSGAGGTITIQAQNIVLQNHGTVTTESKGAGPSGSISLSAADTLRLDNGEIRARSTTTGGGSIALAVGRLFNLRQGAVTTSVAGGAGTGGNITIDHLPFMILDGSRIEANAFGGPGGNITIQAGELIRTPDSVIQASSAQSVSGTITITAPNTDISSSLTVLPGALFDVSDELREACAARGGRPTSSFNAGGRGGLPPDPGTPLVASPFGQPLEQQTATRSPTPSSRPPQAVKPITVAGIPQPVLGSPRLTCRG
jgi:filamentous hemagglutinin family protein